MALAGVAGDAWTLRADVADTIALRRRKGTLGAIELLSFILTKWGVHCVELLENLAWNQHLNHQRPDRGGVPPYGLPVLRSAPVRGGTVNLRDPSLLLAVRDNGEWFGAQLRDIARRTNRIRGVRGVGYMWGIDVMGTAAHVVTEAQAAGLLVCGAGEYTVRLLPPLIATRDELQQGLSLLEQVL